MIYLSFSKNKERFVNLISMQRIVRLQTLKYRKKNTLEQFSMFDQTPDIWRRSMPTGLLDRFVDGTLNFNFLWKTAWGRPCIWSGILSILDAMGFWLLLWKAELLILLLSTNLWQNDSQTWLMFRIQQAAKTAYTGPRSFWSNLENTQII